MLDTTTFNSTPVVSSLATTEHLIATDASGKVKRITRKNAVSQGVEGSAAVASGTTGWLRIAEISYDSSGLISVASAWKTTPSAFLIFSICFHANGVFLLNKISRLSNGNTMFSKVRFVKKSNTISYVDVYVGDIGGSVVYAKLSNCQNILLAIGSEASATIPEGYTAVEFNLIQSGGR